MSDESESVSCSETKLSSPGESMESDIYGRTQEEKSQGGRAGDLGRKRRGHREEEKGSQQGR